MSASTHSAGARRRLRAVSLAAGVVAVITCLEIPPAAGACTGDCDGNGTVSIDELVTLVNIALGVTTATVCSAGDVNQDGQITIDEILAAVHNALYGCGPQPLHAAVHFDQLQEPINQQLVGTVQSSPLADANQLLKTAAQPSSLRLDAGFENSGCPDGSVTGPLYDPETNTFNYCQLDERLGQARAAGATPLLIIDYTPPALGDPACVASNGHGRGAHTCPPADYEKYGALVEAMVQHVFTAFGVTELEVWNEPDGFYFAGTLNDYLNIYKTCDAAVGRVEAMLGRPGRTFHLGGPAAASADRVWINALLAAAVAQPDLRLDFISWHNYANRALPGMQDPRLYAGTYADDTANVRGWLAPFQIQRADWQPLLWINEWNVNAFFDVRADTAYDAAFMVAALHGMQDAGLDRSDRYNTWDSSPASPQGGGNWGLFTDDGAVRPALFGFALWHQLAATRAAVELLDAASQARASASRTRYSQNLLASIDPDTSRATILLYNFVPYSASDAAPPYCGGGGIPVDATLEIDGLAAGTYQVAVQQIDCSTLIQPVASAHLASSITTRTIVPGASLERTVPADSVVLVTLTPSADVAAVGNVARSGSL